MRHLITGGAGFLGSHLTDLLVQRGDHVLILDDLSTGRRENVAHQLSTGKVELVEGMTSDAPLVEQLMAEVDGCFHLASAVGVQLVCDKPLESLLRNVHGCDTVIGAAARHGVRLLFASTSEIYGKDSVGSLHEWSDRLLGPPQRGRWGYANAKVFGEMLAFGYASDQAARNVVVRLFNTVGPRQTGVYGMVVPSFVRQALAGQDLTVFGDGTQSRCFAHVFDVVRAIAMLFDDERADGQAFNIGVAMEITIAELAEKVIERTAASSRVRFVPFEDAYSSDFEELGRRKPDTAVVEALTGWRATLTIDDAIDDVIAYQSSSLRDRLGQHGDHEQGVVAKPRTWGEQALRRAA